MTIVGGISVRAGFAKFVVALWILGCSLATVALLFSLFAKAWGIDSWVDEFVGVPTTRSMALLGLFAVSAYALSRTSTPVAIVLLTLAGILGIYWLQTSNSLPLGDQDQWIQQARTSEVWLSEPYANIIQKVTVAFSPSGAALAFLAPLAGVIFVVIYMALGRDLSRRQSDSWFLLPIFFIGTGYVGLFNFGFVENTILSLPFLAVFVWAGLVQIRNRGANSRALSFVAPLALACATLIHAQNLILSPALVVLTWFSNEGETFASAIRKLTQQVGIYGLTLFLGIVTLFPLGFNITLGNATGGAAGGAFVPLFESDKGLFDRFTMFSLEHFIEFGNIVFFCVPTVVLVPLALLFKWSRRIVVTSAESLRFAFLTVLSLGYFAFVFLWNFDLGSPRDLDLMITLGMGLGLAVYALLSRIFERYQWAFVYILGAQVIIQLVITDQLRGASALLSL